MKQTDKNKSSLVAVALVIGTVFILSVVYQNWTVDDIIQKPVAFNEKVPTKENVSLEEIEVNIVYSSEDDNKLLADEFDVELSFSEAFSLAREVTGPGCTFVWNENLYTTDRAGDYQIDEYGYDKYVLDTTSNQSTAGVSITIAP